MKVCGHVHAAWFPVAVFGAEAQLFPLHSRICIEPAIRPWARVHPMRASPSLGFPSYRPSRPSRRRRRTGLRPVSRGR